MKRHRFHAICPYFAMFPETFVQKNLVYSEPMDIVLDPFSGRGTTVFQSLLGGRKGVGIDINPIAVCVSRAKACAPAEGMALRRLAELKAAYSVPNEVPERMSEFFRLCFDGNTLSQIAYLRQALDWRRNKTDCFIAALALGCLHGESHRSNRYLSNRMPRTISTKPAYSVRWWRARNLTPPARDVFGVLRSEIQYRFVTPPPERKGLVKEGDARKAHSLLKYYEGRVGLVITSPPYLDTTDFSEDQWLRNWFLGGEPIPSIGTGGGDHRHVNRLRYWRFVTEAFAGVAPLLRPKSTIAIRIGGKKITFDEAEAELRKGLKAATGGRVVLVSGHETEIGLGQLHSFRPSAPGSKREFDFVFRVT